MTACAGAPRTEAEYAAQVHTFDSRFDDVVRHEGPSVSSGSLLAGNVFGQARLRTVVDKATGRMLHQLYVDLAYDGRRFRRFESASFEGGGTLPLLAIDHERLGCSKHREPWPCRYAETVGVELPLSFLRAHEHSGFSVRMNAREGSTIIFTVPPHYISGQLQAVGLAPEAPWKQN